MVLWREVQHVQSVDQHQSDHARPPARSGGHLAADAAPGFEGLGFEPLPLPFVAYGPFGGAFHGATLCIALDLTSAGRNRRTRIPFVDLSQMRVGRPDNDPVPLPAVLHTGKVVLPLVFRCYCGRIRVGGHT